MRIVRPWAAQGDNFEVMVPEEADWAELAGSLSEALVDLEAAQRYLVNRYAVEA